MFQRYGKQAAFLFVYIREAHPADSNWADPKLDIADPKSAQERGKIARTCASSLALTLPMVVDDMTDTANQLYCGWPERIYVIERGGKIAYKGGLGPFGFDPAAAEQALARLLD